MLYSKTCTNHLRNKVFSNEIMSMLSLFPKKFPDEDRNTYVPSSLPCTQISDPSPRFKLTGQNILTMKSSEGLFVVAELEGGVWAPPDKTNVALECDFLASKSPAIETSEKITEDWNMRLPELTRIMLMEPGFVDIFKSETTDKLLLQSDMRGGFRIPNYIDSLIEFLALCQPYAVLLNDSHNFILGLCEGEVKDQADAVYFATLIIKILEDGFIQSDHKVSPRTETVLSEVQKKIGRDEVRYLQYLANRVADHTTFGRRVEPPNEYAAYFHQLLARQSMASDIRETFVKSKDKEKLALSECCLLAKAGYEEEFLSLMSVLHELAGQPFCGPRILLYALALTRRKLGMKGSGFDGWAELRTAAGEGVEELEELRKQLDPIEELKELSQETDEEAMIAAYSYEAVGDPFVGIRHCFISCMNQSARMIRLIDHGIPFLKTDDTLQKDYETCVRGGWDRPVSYEPFITENDWIRFASAALTAKELNLVSSRNAQTDHLYRFSCKPRPGVKRRSFHSFYTFEPEKT